MVGDGALRPHVERSAGPNVRLLGHRRDVSRLLQAADFFVLVSSREGFAFGLLEAMAHGLPAVVTDLPENIEAIGDSGIAVPWNDETALAAALRRLSEDERERVELGERARSRVRELFNAEQMIERTSALYDDLLAGRP
jgi:glycosyltransferase involved in cell wall biosynthesis